jgi:uncharacterized protein
MPYRILSLDGGGIRGLVSAIWLNRLEQRLGSPLRNYFELVAGTSTGSLIACGVSLGIPTSEIINLYLKQGREVFPPSGRRLWSRISRSFSQGLDAPRYDGEGLKQVLQGVFGNARFGELSRRTLVTSYDALNREALVFKNDRSFYNELPVWEICKASASAPTFFPAHVMTIDGQAIPLIDGGVVANNPTACAIAEAVRINEALSGTESVALSQFVVASFGTGETTRPISIREAQEWGTLEWAQPLIGVLFDGSADSVHYIAKQLLANDRYFRFQTPLATAYDDIDNADATNLKALVGVAEAYLNEKGNALIDRLVPLLKGS